jgi:hypothetical protein
MAALAAGSMACDVTDRIVAPDTCTLALNVDTPKGREPVEPPYVVALSPRGSEPPTAISFQGNGWSLVDVMQIGPDGAVVDIYRGEGLMINQGMVAFTIDRPGTWRFRLGDAKAGCFRELSVEVRPPPDV